MMNLKAFRSGSRPLKTLSYWLVFLLAQPWILVGGAHAAYVDDTGGRLPDASNDSYNFAVADVDGVNGSDLLVANKGQSRLLINDGNGVFSDETAARLPVALHTTLGVVLADFDGANGPDAFLAGDGQNRLLMNDGSGNFTDETATRLPTAMRVSIDAAAGDLDDDGDLDLVVANRRSANRILINDGSGNFTDQTASRLTLDADFTYGVALGDADGNGSPDIFFANFAGQNRLHLNNNLGVFNDVTDSQLPAVNGTTGGAAFLDADNDGDADIATAEGGNGVGLLINNGGSFTAAPMPSMPEFGIRVRPGDINFDGSMDLLVATMGQDRVLLNDGSGSFSDATAGEMPADDRRSFGALLFDADSDLDLDAVLATPAGQNRFLDNAIAGPRILIDISPDYIEVTDTVTIDLTAFDENGVATLEAFVVAPSAPGTEIPLTLVGDTNAATATYVPGETGVHIVRVRAGDGVNTSEKEKTFAALANDTQAPTVTLAIDPNTVTQGEAVDFTVTASDDRAVADLGLTVDGVDVPLDNQGMATLTPLTVGALPVVATASDAAGNTASDSGTLTVLADVESPTVSLAVTPASLDVTNPWSITTGASDNIAVTASSLVVNGPAGVPADTPVPVAGDGTASYTPFIPGDYTFTWRALDAAGNEGVASETVAATGVQDLEAPMVSISVVPGTTIPGGTVTVTVNATDNIFVLDRTLSINGTPQTLDADNSVAFTAPLLGDYTAEATATDPSGNTGTDTVVFSAVDPATDTDPPQVAITSPAEGDEISGLAPIIGTATDLTLVSYNLAYKRTDDPVSAYVEFATGAQVVENGLLGNFDTTVVENGIYDIRLQAFDVNGLGSQVTQTVRTLGEFKPGIFTISYEDMNVPVSGITLSVNRDYDSRRRNRSGDFGYGWNLRVVQDGTYVNNRELGEGWTGLPGGGFFNFPCQGGIREDLYHITEIRFSDTEFYQFSLQPELTGAALGGGACEIASVSFVQVGGVPGATLVPLAETPDWVLQGDILYLDFNVYNPREVELTTLNGRSFILDLEDGLEQISDLNGNTVTITPTGVTHSNGKSIAITRDGAGRVTSIEDPLGNTTTYTYDAEGNLATSTDRAGNTTSYQYLPGSYLERIIDPEGNIPTRNEYDASGRLVAQIDADGNRTEFDRDVDAGTEQVTDRNGAVTITQYDAEGNLDSAQIGSATTTYTHDDRGNKLTETDPLGNTTSFSYDALDRMTTQTDPLGNVTSYDYDAERITGITDPLGSQLGFTYDANGNLTEQDDADGNLIQGFAYAANGDLTQITTAAGATGIESNPDGNPTKLTDPGGAERLFTYDANGRRTSSTVRRTVGGSLVDETTAFTYDANGRVLTRDGPLAGSGDTTAYAYDGNGRKIRETDPLGRETDYSYDSGGNLSRIDYPDGSFRAFGYDLTDRLTAETDPEGNTTFYEYDNQDRLTRTIFPDGGSLTLAYDLAGNLISETDGLGNTTSYTHDALSRLLTETDPLGNETTYTYAGNQINPTTVTDPRGNTTTYAYDDSMLLLEYPVQTTLPGGAVEAQTWGPNSRITSRTDANGNTTSFEYDAVGNLTKVTDALGNETTYTYDEVGNRLTQTDALGRTTSFTYDALGNVLSRTLPGGQVESFTYDLVGNLLSHSDFNGDTSSYTYDAMDRRITATLPDLSVETYAYNATGMPVSITDATGTSTFTYDAMDRIATATTPDGVTLTYSYDAVGNRTALDGAGDRDFGYDANRRLASVTVPGTPDPLVTSYGYDAAGNLASIAYPNGTEAVLTYNNRNQTVQVTHLAPDGSTVLADFQYDLDAVGNRIKLIESGGLEVDYSYDALNQLTSATESAGGSGRNWAYSYDAVGNVLTFDIPGTTDSATYDANDRLLTAGGRSFSYDANGNLLAIDADGNAGTTDDITSFSYDSRNRLIQRVEADGTISQFDYDARGNRISRTVGGVTTGYVVDSDDPGGVSRVLQERDGSGTPTVTYVQGHRLLGMERSGTESWVHSDALGSVRALSSPAGGITDSYAYDPFGNLDSSSGSTINEYGFAGERQDPSTGLYYLRARYLDPEIARFISRDPHPGVIDMPASLHPYQYAWNNPVNNIDPNGEFSMVSVSISISIAATLSAVYFTIIKPAKEAYDELQTLLQTIPNAKLNKESTRDQLGFTAASVQSAVEEEDITNAVNLGGGAVERAYKVVYKMSTTLGKVVALIHANNSATWMKYLPEYDGKPAHYLDCGFNGYVQKTYSLGLVVGAASGKKIQQAANIIAAYLSYFNFLVLVMETVNDFVGTGDAAPDSCPAISS